MKKNKQKATSENIKASKIKNIIEKKWGKSSFVKTALNIVDYLVNNNKKEGDSFLLTDFIQLLEYKEMNKTILSDLLFSLNILTTFEPYIFRSGGVLIDDQDKHHSLTSKQFENATKTNTLIHPVTKKEIKDVTDHILPVFILDKNITDD